jgi:hypothetical protein
MSWDEAVHLAMLPASLLAGLYFLHLMAVEKLEGDSKDE